MSQGRSAGASFESGERVTSAKVILRYESKTLMISASPLV